MASRQRGRPLHPDVLTPREWAVLDLYRHGLTRAAVARLCGTTDHAVRFHLRNVRDKLGAGSIAELRAWPGFPSTSAVRSGAERARRFRPMDSDVSIGEIGQISLLSRSAGRTEAWYRDVVRLKHLFTFGGLVFFDCDGTRLYFREVGDDEWRPGSTIYFRVADIHVAHRVLADRGVRFAGAPHMIHRHADGAEEWMAFFDDPDGNILAVMSRVVQVAEGNGGSTASGAVSHG